MISAGATARKSVQETVMLLSVKAISGLVLALALATPATAQQRDASAPFTPDRVQKIEDIIQQYLMAHPEVLVEALTRHQERQKLAEKQRRQEAIVAQREALAEDPDAPVLGNPEGDVLIVEFFDYRCGYCRRVANTLRRNVEKDGNIRLVMKEFPILGPPSVLAARAALAAAKQGKYKAFHFALMGQRGDMSLPYLLQVARDLDLDAERLEQDMQAPDIDQALRRNLDLARELGINGTPAFVIGDTLHPGALSGEQLRKLVAKDRAKAS